MPERTEISRRAVFGLTRKTSSESIPNPSTAPPFVRPLWFGAISAATGAIAGVARGVEEIRKHEKESTNRRKAMLVLKDATIVAASAAITGTLIGATSD